MKSFSGVQGLPAHRKSLRQKRRKLHIQRLEEELQRMREAIDEREKVREQIIGRRVSELTGERYDLDF